MRELPVPTHDGAQAVTTASAHLLARVARLSEQVAELDRRIAAIEDGPRDIRLRVVDRVRILLSKSPGVAFSPREIAEACAASVSAVGKALRSMVSCGEVVRTPGARYVSPRP